MNDKEDILDNLPTSRPAAKSPARPAAKPPVKVEKTADFTDPAVKSVAKPAAKPPVSNRAPVSSMPTLTETPAAEIFPPAPAAPAAEIFTPAGVAQAVEDGLPAPSMPAAAQITSRKVAAPAVTADNLPAAVPALELATNVNAYWDDFLISLENGTLLALYELGVTSMSEFATYALADLQRPRGRLTEAQAKEVQARLLPFGIELAKVSRRGGGDTGGQAASDRAFGRRRVQTPLPADATPAQRRQHRLSNNRFTM